MIFSKSFGYAIRGILYVAIRGKPEKRIQLDEIAENLAVPRYFLGKVMKKVVKEGFLDSTKGHSGGFSINEKTLDISLLEIAELVGELNESKICVLRFRACNDSNPCPLHQNVSPLRTQWKRFLTGTHIRDLIDFPSARFLESIASD